MAWGGGGGRGHPEVFESSPLPPGHAQASVPRAPEPAYPLGALSSGASSSSLGAVSLPRVRSGSPPPLSASSLSPHHTRRGLPALLNLTKTVRPERPSLVPSPCFRRPVRWAARGCLGRSREIHVGFIPGVLRGPPRLGVPEGSLWTCPQECLSGVCGKRLLMGRVLFPEMPRMGDVGTGF